MSTVTLDAELRNKLGGLTEQVKLCDESGVTLAHVLPDALYRKMVCERFSASVSDEELDEIARTPGFLPLEQILKGLGKR